MPTVPAIARPAIPDKAISLNALPEAPDRDSPATVVAGKAGRVTAVGLTAGVATVQLGGTDRPPTVFASPIPADSRGDGTVPAGKFSRGAGNGCTGAGPTPGHGVCPFQPLTILSVC